MLESSQAMCSTVTSLVLQRAEGRFWAVQCVKYGLVRTWAGGKTIIHPYLSISIVSLFDWKHKSGMVLIHYRFRFRSYRSEHQTYYILLKGGFGVIDCNKTNNCLPWGNHLKKQIWIQAMFSSPEVTGLEPVPKLYPPRTRHWNTFDLFILYGINISRPQKQLRWCLNSTAWRAG